jgi:hypothetical protein
MITFKQIEKDFNIFNKLPFQTDLDETKVLEMKQSYLNNSDYLVYKNKIVIAVVSNSFVNDYKLYVVDGQHRLEMAKKLYKDEDINDYLIICYYKIDSDMKMKELFKEINRDSYKNNIYISLNEFQETLYDLTKEYLKNKFSLYFPEKKSQINRRYSLTEFLDLLASKSYFDNFKNLSEIIVDIEVQNKQFNKLIDYQEYYNDNPNIFYKDERLCVKNGFIISLKNNNFIDYLMDDKTIPKHNFKNQKKIISPKLRNKILKDDIVEKEKDESYWV